MFRDFSHQRVQFLYPRIQRNLYQKRSAISWVETGLNGRENQWPWDIDIVSCDVLCQWKECKVQSKRIWLALLCNILQLVGGFGHFLFSFFLNNNPSWFSQYCSEGLNHQPVPTEPVKTSDQPRGQLQCVGVQNCWRKTWYNRRCGWMWHRMNVGKASVLQSRYHLKANTLVSLAYLCYTGFCISLTTTRKPSHVNHMESICMCAGTRAHTHTCTPSKNEANSIGPSHDFSEIDANFDWPG